jgi:hypothetical protein
VTSTRVLRAKAAVYAAKISPYRCPGTSRLGGVPRNGSQCFRPIPCFPERGQC